MSKLMNKEKRNRNGELQNGGNLKTGLCSRIAYTVMKKGHFGSNSEVVLRPVNYSQKPVKLRLFVAVLLCFEICTFAN